VEEKYTCKVFQLITRPQLRQAKESFLFFFILFIGKRERKKINITLRSLNASEKKKKSMFRGKVNGGTFQLFAKCLYTLHILWIFNFTSLVRIIHSGETFTTIFLTLT
jgi:hypothetical protein